MKYFLAIAYLIFASSTLSLANAPSVKSDLSSISIFTDLDSRICRKEIDHTDPNETPFYRCPGVAGYSLILRSVDSGRTSIDIVDPKQNVSPLNYHEFITRHMFELAGKAEWRVQTKNGKQVPIALIVAIQAHEDNDDPGKVTHTYWSVAKIVTNHACVTDKILETTTSKEQVWAMANSAQSRSCAAPLPTMKTADGEILR